MRVFVVMEGCQYEGTGIVSLHLTEKGALDKAEEIVKTTRKEYIKVPVESDRQVHFWRDTSDILEILKYDVGM